MTINIRRILRSLFFIATVAVLFLLLLVLYRISLGMDPQGDGNEYCNKTEMLPQKNAQMIVSYHVTVCSGFGGNSSVYIYIHQVDEPEQSKFLAFRYFNKYESELPKIHWTSGSSLQITVGNVSQITKQLREVNGVKIEYKIEKVDYP